MVFVESFLPCDRTVREVDLRMLCHCFRVRREERKRESAWVG